MRGIVQQVRNSTFHREFKHIWSETEVCFVFAEGCIECSLHKLNWATVLHVIMLYAHCDIYVKLWVLIKVNEKSLSKAEIGLN